MELKKLNDTQVEVKKELITIMEKAKIEELKANSIAQIEQLNNAITEMDLILAEFDK